MNHESKFCEQDTKKFYDETDSLYRSFWDKSGSLHWGIYRDLSAAKLDHETFMQACQNYNDIILRALQPDEYSLVLDAACGNGNTIRYFVERCQAKFVGVDLSEVKIKNAEQQAFPGRDRVEYIQDSLEQLKFANDYFSHVYSQSSLYHIHDMNSTMREIFRVLKSGGLFVFDNFHTFLFF